MGRAFGAAAVVFVLAGGIGYATAQGTMPSTAGQGTPQQSMPQGNLNLNNGQAQSITDGLRNEQSHSNQPGYQGQIGSKPPSSMQAQQLPDGVTSDVPQVKGYYFVKLQDRILLLDPDTKTVVEIVPAIAETTGSDSNGDSGRSPGGNGMQPGGSGNR